MKGGKIGESKNRRIDVLLYICDRVVFFSWTGIHNFVFTSQVNIIPDYYPFPPCVAEQCKGTLL